MKIINPYKMFQGAFIPNAIMTQKSLSQSAKLMWARLAQFAGKDGRCFPKIEKLGEEIGISRAQAKRVIKELVEQGFIIVRHATGKEKLMHKSNEYFFLDHPCFGNNYDPSGGVINDPSGGCINDPSLEGAKMTPEENHIRESYENTSMSGNNPDAAREKKKKYHGTEEDDLLAKRMFEEITVVNATVKEPNWDRWANEIRLMREQDGRSHSQIWRVFSFANKDHFWSHNILSPGSLRKHYARLSPRAGILESQVRGSFKKEEKGKVCGTCVFFGQGRKFCHGEDKIPNHLACDLYRAK